MGLEISLLVGLFALARSLLLRRKQQPTQTDMAIASKTIGTTIAAIAPGLRP